MYRVAVWCSLEQSLILCSWPMASTLASLCSSSKWTFWTYVVTTSLFSPYLKNFMFHTMLDATDVVLRVHYKSMKCNVLFSQDSVRTLFRWGGHFSYMSKEMYSSYNSAKIIKIDQDFPKLWSQMYCHLFMVHSVYAFVAEMAAQRCTSRILRHTYTVNWVIDFHICCSLITARPHCSQRRALY